MCLHLLELCHRIAEIGLLDFLGQEAVALLMQSPPGARLEQPVTLICEEYFQRVGVRVRAQANELHDVEDDGFSLHLQTDRRRRMCLQACADRFPERPVEEPLELLERSKERHADVQRRLRTRREGRRRTRRAPCHAPDSPQASRRSRRAQDRASWIPQHASAESEPHHEGSVRFPKFQSGL
jgi:hypothetical protein